MRFLRSAIFAFGLMGLAAACGGNNKGAEEPEAPMAEENPCDMGMEGEENPCDMGMEGEENPCDMGMGMEGEENPCAAAEEGGEEW